MFLRIITIVIIGLGVLIIMKRSEISKELFNSGYNCSQAVALAFADCIDIPREALSKIASSFGGGFGRLREVCGAFSGMCIVTGYLCGYDTADSENKMEHYAKVRRLAELFKEKNGGTYICRELIGGTEKLSNENPAIRSSEYKEKRPCAEIVSNAAEILEQFLIEKGLKI